MTYRGVHGKRQGLMAAPGITELSLYDTGCGNAGAVEQLPLPRCQIHCGFPYKLSEDSQRMALACGFRGFVGGWLGG